MKNEEELENPGLTFVNSIVNIDVEEPNECGQFSQYVVPLVHREFIYTDSKDEWENYHIQLKYKDHFSEVTIVYGIGSFCVIAPIEKLDEEKSTIFDLEKIYVKTTGDIIFVN